MCDSAKDEKPKTNARISWPLGLREILGFALLIASVADTLRFETDVAPPGWSIALTLPTSLLLMMGPIPGRIPSKRRIVLFSVWMLCAWLILFEALHSDFTVAGLRVFLILASLMFTLGGGYWALVRAGFGFWRITAEFGASLVIALSICIFAYHAIDQWAAHRERIALRAWKNAGVDLVDFPGHHPSRPSNVNMERLAEVLHPYHVRTVREIAEQQSYISYSGSNLCTLSVPREELSAGLTTLGHPGDLDGSDSDSLPANFRKAMESESETIEKLTAILRDTDGLSFGAQPELGLESFAPSNQVFRGLFQVFSADVALRLIAGDLHAAESRLIAMDHINRIYWEDPSIVRFMLGGSGSLMTAKRYAQLPVGYGEGIPPDPGTVRALFLDSMAREAWDLYMASRVPSSARSIRYFQEDADPKIPIVWSEMPPIVRAYAARRSLGYAMQAERFGDPNLLQAADLALEGLTGTLVSTQNVIEAPSLMRAFVRTNGVLLVWEQAKCIRTARQAIDGIARTEPLQIPSTVAPNAVWKVVLDHTNRTATLHLENAPEWTRSDIFGEGFYLLPLDGSVPWKFAVR